MPPKKGKLHVLAPQVQAGYTFADNIKKKSFVLGKQFATGGFGRIYTCKEEGSKEDLCVKIEPFDNGPLFTEVAVFQRCLKKEMIAEWLKEKKLKSIGVPPLISFGFFMYKEDKLRFLVMPKYATSLEAIRALTFLKYRHVREKSGKLDARAAFSVSKAVTKAYDYLQSKNYTHGDCKAANILLPSPSDFDGAVLVDYGLARMSASNEEKPDKKRAHNGTAIFTSLDAHIGLQPSYRGDFEILVYNIMLWLSGGLPWLKDEPNPAVVQSGKEKFRQALETNMKSLIGPDFADPISKIYRLAEKTPYTSKVDVDKIAKLLDVALSACGKKSTKAIAESPATSSKSAPRTTATSTRRRGAEDQADGIVEKAANPTPTRRRVVVVKKVDKEVEEEESTDVRTVRPAPATSRKAVAEMKEIIPVRSTRRPPIRRAPVSSSEDEEEEEGGYGRNRTPPKREKRESEPMTADDVTKALNDAAVRHAAMFKQSSTLGIIPGLHKAISTIATTTTSVLSAGEREATMDIADVDSPTASSARAQRALKRAASAGPTPYSSSGETPKKMRRRAMSPAARPISEEEEENDSSEEKVFGVDSATKRDAEMLRRTVPGIRNMAKGRRSKIIKDIAERHRI